MNYIECQNIFQDIERNVLCNTLNMMSCEIDKLHNKSCAIQKKLKITENTSNSWFCAVHEIGNQRE